MTCSSPQRSLFLCTANAGLTKTLPRLPFPMSRTRAALPLRDPVALALESLAARLSEGIAEAQAHLGRIYSNGRGVCMAESRS